MGPYLRLRQLCLVATSLESVAGDLTEVFGLEICHRDPNVGHYGLENFLLPIGSNFLEVVAPLKPGAETAAGRYLQRRKGDGGYMVIMDCDDVVPWRAHMGTVGVRLVEDRAYEGKAHLMQFHPRDTGACIMEIDHHIGGDDPMGRYQWAGDQWQEHVRTERTARIAGAILQANDPAALAARWSQILKRPATEAGRGTVGIALDNARLSFEPAQDGRGDGLGAIVLDVNDKPAIMKAATRRGLTVAGDVVTICGTRFHLQAAA